MNTTQKQTTWEGKTRCDCPCAGPFCQSLSHPCSKPNEHYLQSRDTEIAIRTEEREAVLQEVEEEIIGVDDIDPHNAAILGIGYESQYWVKNGLRAEQRQKLQSLRERYEEGGKK